MTGRPRDIILAKNPAIRQLLDAVENSPMSDSAIMAKAGIGGAYLHRLRSGQISGNLLSFQSIAGAVGFRVKLEKDD